MSWEGEHSPKVSNISEIVAQGMKPAEVAELMLKTFGVMMFEHGFVHADPHPGNLLVRRNPHESYLQRITCSLKRCFGSDIHYAPQLVILDHGLYVDIPRDVRRDWCLLWRSLVLGHRQTLTSVSNRLMPSGGGILTAALSFGLVFVA
jgi:aarF domain-containing kinase